MNDAAESASSEWSLEDEPAPEKKRRIPRWLLFSCGGGCLLLVLICGVLGFFFARTASEARDTETQWGNLAEVLPYDERPTELKLEMGFNWGFLMDMSQFALVDPENDLAVVVISSDAPQQDFDVIFDPEGVQAPWGMGEPKEPEVGEVEIAGRPCTVLRFSGIDGSLPLLGEIDPLGAGAWVDMRSSEYPGRIVQFRRQSDSREPIPDDVMQAFFSHFDPWRN